MYDFLIGALIKADSLLLHIEKDPYYETMYAITDSNGEIISKSFPLSDSSRGETAS